MLDTQLSLSEYLATVQEVIRIAFDEPVWVKAEIRNLSIKGGHYYLELAEKDENTDKVIASCKATIWKFSAAKMVLKFERESGIELSKDLNVLIKIKAKFDPQYGFSVNVEDIDSSYTLGDIARRYQQILERLTTEGLVDKNKLLPTPFDIQNVLVIAPENAAWLKIQNGCVVLTDDKSTFANAKTGGDGALVFNVENKENDQLATDNETITTSEVTVIAGNGNVQVVGAEGKKVVITNILGQTVANTVITSSDATIAAPQGVVVVAVEGEEAVKAIVK